MKPFLPKRRRSGVGPAGAPRALAVLARKSPAKRSPFKRRPLGAAPGLPELPPLGSGGADLPCNIKVAVRVRPENERETAGCFRNIIEVVDDQMLVFDPKEDADEFFFHGKKQERRDLNKKVQRDQKFAFDCVFGPNSTNEDVFEGTTKDLIDVIFNGFNCSVFVYGATGSGKTHTMLGKENNPGITLRTVVELYKRIEQVEEEISCEVMISYLEIYNENVFDLINPGTQLQLREDGKAGVNIPGLSRHKPSGPEDLLRLLQFGNGNRTQHPTDANKESSRSHAVFQVYLKQKGRAAGLSADMKVAKLSMIDLAGSERGSVTSSRGAARFREGANINKSLLALGNCINALADGSKYIPYRNSKLTRLLKDSIGGNCRTVMISNISPSSMTYEDTYNTLKYADRAKKIKIRLKENVVSVDYHVAQYAKIVEDLKLEIQGLKDKITSLEEENQALKNQVEDHPEDLDSEKIDSVELLALKKQLADFEVRQKDYDDLKARIDCFEKERKEAESREAKSLEAPKVAEMDEQTSRFVDEHKSLLKRNFKHQSDIYMIDLQKSYHKRKFDRCSAVIAEGILGESGAKKLKKSISNLEMKQEKFRKRNRPTMQQYLASRKVVNERAGLPKKDVDHLKTDLTNEHLKRLLLAMHDEQNRTEELLMSSLQQLQSSHLLLLSYGKSSDQRNNDFQDLISRIQCTRVQYRDSNLVETNEDSTADRIGDFFAKLLDLEAGIESNLVDPDANETLGVESKPQLEVIPVHEADTDADEEIVEETDLNDEEKKFWRPPTPPKKMSPNANKTPPSPKLNTIHFPKFSTGSTTPFTLDLDEHLSPNRTIAESAFDDLSTKVPSLPLSGDATFCISSNDQEKSKPAVHTELFKSSVLSGLPITGSSSNLFDKDAGSLTGTSSAAASFQPQLYKRFSATSSGLHELTTGRNRVSIDPESNYRSSNVYAQSDLSSSDATFCIPPDEVKVTKSPEMFKSSVLSASYLGAAGGSFSVLSYLKDDLITPTSPLQDPVLETENTNVVADAEEDSNLGSLNISLVDEAKSSNFDATVILEDKPAAQSMDATIILSSNDAAEESRRTTFLVPSRNENKENLMKASAPIAMVSPMTVTTTTATSKMKKTLKKQPYHPIASTSNLRSLLDYRPTTQKPRDPLAASQRHPSAASTPTLNPPSYMQGTAASRIKLKVGGPSQATHPPGQRSRSPLGDQIHETNHLTTTAVESTTTVPIKNVAGGPHRTLKKSLTTSNLKSLNNK